MRSWLYDQLVALTSLPAPSVLAGGSLTSSPEQSRFIVYRMQDPLPRFFDGDKPSVIEQVAQVWVYDKPGSYSWIDEELMSIANGLSGQMSSIGGVNCRWTGSSGELADDEFNRIVRNGSFVLSEVVQ